MDDNEGHHMQAKVVEIGDEQVTMDFNHLLAGMVMHFEGKIQDVRPATTEELAHGHVHGAHGHHHGEDEGDDEGEEGDHFRSQPLH